MMVGPDTMSAGARALRRSTVTVAGLSASPMTARRSLAVALSEGRASVRIEGGGDGAGPPA